MLNGQSALRWLTSCIILSDFHATQHPQLFSRGHYYQRTKHITAPCNIWWGWGMKSVLPSIRAWLSSRRTLLLYSIKDLMIASLNWHSQINLFFGSCPLLLILNYKVVYITNQLYYYCSCCLVPYYLLILLQSQSIYVL